MKKNIFIISLIVSLFIGMAVQGQSYKEHRGDLHASRFNYDKAIECYLVVMDTELENNFVMKKLGECYKHINNDTASVRWYEELMTTNKAEPDDLYNYSIVLKNVGKYDESGEVLKLYSQKKQSSQYLLNHDVANSLLKDSLRFKITLVEQSSEFDDFSPAYFGNKLIFASARQGDDFLHREYERDGQPFLQLFVADTLANGQLDSIVPFDRKLNTRFHEGPVSFCPADSSMYFTRNNYKIFKGVSNEGEVNLKIYKSKFTYQHWLKRIDNLLDSIGIDVHLDDDDWRRVKEFQYNSKEFSTGHPTLTADGRVMYFVSNQPGGKGGTDIYRCFREGANEWSEPQNMKELNTEGNEMFPFIHQSGVLFFASDGWPGLGGLDIFKAEPKAGAFSKPVNMGAPLNSIEDDFGLIADEETKAGYFSSNRSGGKGKDDLYHVVFNNEIKYVLAGYITEKDTETTIANAQIKIKELEKGEELSLTADEQGFYFCDVDFTKSYQVQCAKGLYLPFSELPNFKDIKVVNDTIYYNIELDYYGIYGSVFIKGSDEKVPNVELTCTPTNGGEAIVLSSDTVGDFRTLLAKDTDYELAFNKTDFFALKADYTTKSKVTGYINVNEFIVLEIEEIVLNKTIEIPNIYFDLGKWNIREDAAIELIKVVEFMNDNPTLNIELGSHTDARGSAASNQRLSQKRAESSVNWIVDHGIDKGRIAAKGYGENKLKNRCADGVRCSEAEHQENRRTEIRITSF